jgi:PAS domain S-box-containing protein
MGAGSTDHVNHLSKRDVLKASVERIEQLEEELTKYRENFMAVLNSIADPICIKDREHRWIMVNDAFCAIAGQNREALIGKSDYDFFPRHEADMFWSKDEEVFLTGKENINEETITDSSGVTRNLVTKKTLFHDHRGRAFVAAIGRDVTEQKQAELALRENEEFMRLVIDTTPAQIFVKDKNGTFLLVNRREAEAHGLLSDEMIGKHELDFTGSNGKKVNQAQRYLEDDRTVIESQKPKYIPEEPFISDDGSVRWLETTKIPITLKGKREYVLGVAIDITARKQAEVELNEKDEQLRQSQKMEAVGRLAGGVAHDFNNLLTAIIGYADMLRHNPFMDDRALHGVEEIRKSADRAALLTQQLLAFSRKQVMQPKVLDLNHLLTDTEMMLRRLIGENISLRTRFGSGIAYVRADPGQIEQVIVNLVVNARDSMPQGGSITITTGTEELEETIDAKDTDFTPGPYVVLSIEDTGQGFDEETRERLFEPFFTTKEKGKGTGLGLSTVYGIVRQSGGMIRVRSETGRGSIFTVYLPAVREAENAADEASRVYVPKGQSETILVVEDEEMVRTMMGEVLRSYGYNVLEAANGKETLEMVGGSRRRVDLLVTDVIMPGMSGKQLAAELLKQTPDLRILFVSGYTGDAIADHGILEDGVHFLQKPFTPQSLAAAVHRMLAES